MKIKTSLMIALLLASLTGQNHAHEEQAALSNVLIGQLAQRVNDLEKRFNLLRKASVEGMEHDFAYMRLLEEHINMLTLAIVRRPILDEDCFPDSSGSFKLFYEGLEDAAADFIAAREKIVPGIEVPYVAQQLDKYFKLAGVCKQ